MCSKVLISVASSQQSFRKVLIQIPLSLLDMNLIVLLYILLLAMYRYVLYVFLLYP